MKTILARIAGAGSVLAVLALVAFFDAAHIPPAYAPVLAAPTSTPVSAHGYLFDQYLDLFTAPVCENQAVPPALSDGQVSILQCDSNGNLLASIVGGSFSGSLTSGSASIGRLNDAHTQRSGAALQSGCSLPCSFTTTSLSTVYYVDNDGPSMTGTQTVTVYDSASASGDIILFTQNMGNSQERVWGPTGRHLTSGFVTVVVAGSVLGATANIEVGGR